MGVFQINIITSVGVLTCGATNVRPFAGGFKKHLLLDFCIATLGITCHDMNGRQDQGRAPGLDDEDLGSSRVDPVEAVDIFTLFEKRFYRGSASLGR